MAAPTSFSNDMLDIEQKRQVDAILKLRLKDSNSPYLVMPLAKPYEDVERLVLTSSFSALFPNPKENLLDPTEDKTSSEVTVLYVSSLQLSAAYLIANSIPFSNPAWSLRFLTLELRYNIINSSDSLSIVFTYISPSPTPQKPNGIERTIFYSKYEATFQKVGYDGHNQLKLPALGPESVRDFLAITDSLFKKALEKTL